MTFCVIGNTHCMTAYDISLFRIKSTLN